MKLKQQFIFPVLSWLFAAVATARQLLITCWAMLRDETDWREPEPGVA